MSIIPKMPVNSKEFTYEIILSKGLGKLTRKAEKSMIILAERAITKKKYFYEDDKKDCLQNSYYVLFTKWQKFNPDVTSNAFAYFTEVHKRATTEMMNIIYLKKGLKKEEQNYVKTISMNSSNNGQGLFNI